ncbi:hypothetical protein YC2023_004700 [Brassica napus]
MTYFFDSRFSQQPTCPMKIANWNCQGLGGSLELVISNRKTPLGSSSCHRDSGPSLGMDVVDFAELHPSHPSYIYSKPFVFHMQQLCQCNQYRYLYLSRASSVIW